MIRGLRHAKDRQVVGFRAAAGKDDLRGAASQERGHRFARALDGRPRLLSMMMDGRSVPKVLPKVGLHGLKDHGQHGCGGVIVEVNAAHSYFTILRRMRTRGKERVVQPSQARRYRPGVMPRESSPEAPALSGIAGIS